MVGRLGLELGRAGVDGLEDGMDAEPLTQCPHADLPGQFRPQRGDLPIRQPMVLAAPQHFLVEDWGVQEFGSQRNESGDLLDEPRIDARGLGDRLDCGAEAQRQFDVVEPSVGGCLEALQQLVDGEVGVWAVQNPARPVSRERITLPSASMKLRPNDIASPTDFIVVVSVGSAPGNFSNANRGALTTT